MIHIQDSKNELMITERVNNIIKSVKKKEFISLIIEPSSACNLTCKFCDLHSGRLDDRNIKNGVMSLELYKLILNEIEKLDFKFKVISFIGNGEPLINKNIVEMILLIRKLTNKIVLFTNGILMTPNIFNKLILTGINEINISLDTINSKIYEEFKGKNVLSTVLYNLNYAINKVINLNNNYGVLQDFTLYIKVSENGNVYGLNNKNYKEIVEKYKSVMSKSPNIHIKNIPLVEVIHNQKMECHKPCENVFYVIYIKHDGRLSLCCSDTINELNIGKIGNGQLKDILKNEKVNEIRKIHLSGNLDNIPLCKYCGNRTVVDLSNYREELMELI